MNDPLEGRPQPPTYALPLYRPVVTWILLGAIVLVFVLETAAGGSTQTAVLIQLGAKVTPLVAAGEYWRLFTAMFLHIGLLHLFFNGYALLVIGTELERLFGPLRFSLIYFLSGLLGSLASYAFSASISAGASGAIFGLIGALAAFFLVYRERLGSWGRARLSNIVFLIAINLFLGFTQPGIDNLGHLGGLLGGLGLGWAMVPRYEIDPFRGRLNDRTRLVKYWPALLAAVAVLVGGTALVTWRYDAGPQAHLFRGQDAIERQAWDEAVAELEQALALDPSPTDASVYFFLGLAHNHLDQLQPAAESYEAALALDPGDSSSHWNLALTYLELERYPQALEHFQTYLELNPDEDYRVQPYLNLLDQVLPGGS